MAHPQIRLKTQAEIDALDAIEKHFAVGNSAEAFRHAQRVLARLVTLIVEDECELTLTDADGNHEHEAIVIPPQDDDLPIGTVRRWTVKLSDTDRAFAATIRKWSAADSERASNSITVRVMGALLQDLSDGWVLWASDADGSFRLVLA